MAETLSIQVRCRVPWITSLKTRERMLVELDSKKNRVSDLLELLGINDQVWLNALLVVVNGTSASIDKELRSGDEVQIMSAVSGG